MTRALRSRRREEGHLLLWASLFAVFTFAFWGLSFRATRDAVLVDGRAYARATKDDSIRRALAAGMRLLETGTPPAPPASYVVTPSGGTACVVTYTATATSGVWQVDAALASEADVASYAALPGSF